MNMENDLERLRWLATDSSGNDIQVRVSDIAALLKPIDEDSCKVILNNGAEVTVLGSYDVLHDQLAKWKYVNRVCRTYDDDIFNRIIECRRAAKEKALRKNKQTGSFSKDEQAKRLRVLKQSLIDEMGLKEE